MTKIDKYIILEKAVPLFAKGGIDNFSIRKLAKGIPITPSVIYHYFENEDALLRSMFDYLNHDLGEKRKRLPKSINASDMLKQRIVFQLDNQEAIVAVLKYYIAYRNTFPRFKNGFVPDKSALHIEEVLHEGIKTGEFVVHTIDDDAKVITHAINGFLLEYYPHTPKGKEKSVLVERIHKFLLRALMKGGELHEST